MTKRKRQLDQSDSTLLRPPGLYVVGLTGGVATGKSLVTAKLRCLGAYVIDADVVARKVTEPGSRGLRRIRAEFGPEFINSDGTLNRGKLGRLVFGDQEARRRLEELLHPLISERIRAKLDDYRTTAGSPVAFVDAPVLIEAGLHHEVDEVWVVTVPPEVQKCRLMERDGLSEQQAQRRIAAQLPLEEKRCLADVVISNAGTRHETRQQVRDALSELRQALEEC